MEYVEGTDLSGLVKKNGPLPAAKAVNYILQAARGLEYAHRKGIVHRDIKPANLLVDREGTLKILDMGLARISGGDAETQAELTGTGAVMGTVDYMAPEQALSTKHADARADIYSLGCTLYFLLSGHATYGGDTLMAKLLAHREQPIPSLGSAASGELQAVFERMVAKKVADRYQTMSDAIAVLESCGAPSASSPSVLKPVATAPESDSLSFLNDVAPKRAGAQPPARTKPTSARPAAGKCRFNKTLVAVIAAGVIGAIILAAVIIMLQTSTGPESAGAGKESPPGAVHKVVAVSDPAFQTWMAEVATMPAGKQLAAVREKLMELNPDFDGHFSGWYAPEPRIENGVVTEIGFQTAHVSDLSPVRALVRLKNLALNGGSDGTSKFRDLSPLRGLALSGLACGHTSVKDLSPLKGMPLVTFCCDSTDVSDLSPLSGMPLESLLVSDTRVTDLSPLAAVPTLKTLAITPSRIAKGLDIVRQMEGIEKIGTGWEDASQYPAAEFWRKYDAGEFGTPMAAPARPTRDVATIADPAFQKWMNDVAALAPEDQVKAVLKKLNELNPEYASGNDTERFMSRVIERNVVVEFKIFTSRVHDISPVRALGALRRFDCAGASTNGQVSDLRPLRGLGLNYLGIWGTQVVDLTPLDGMPLNTLVMDRSKVTDLSALKSLPLGNLQCSFTRVSDLSPLHKLPLIELYMVETDVTDLSPLEGLKLTTIQLTPARITRGFDVLRHMKSLKTIGVDEDYAKRLPADQFWKKYDAGEFGKRATSE